MMHMPMSLTEREKITKTRQETFDTVARHLIKQGGPSLLERKAPAPYGDGVAQTNCAYRGKEGRMCAAGCLIPDEKYSLTMEAWNAAAVNGPVRAVLIEEGYDPDFVRNLQLAHDECSHEGKWNLLRDELKTVARNYGLSSSVLDE